MEQRERGIMATTETRKVKLDLGLTASAKRTLQTDALTALRSSTFRIERNAVGGLSGRSVRAASSFSTSGETHEGA